MGKIFGIAANLLRSPSSVDDEDDAAAAFPLGAELTTVIFG